MANLILKCANLPLIITLEVLRCTDTNTKVLDKQSHRKSGLYTQNMLDMTICKETVIKRNSQSKILAEGA